MSSVKNIILSLLIFFFIYYYINPDLLNSQPKIKLLMNHRLGSNYPLIGTYKNIFKKNGLRVQITLKKSYQQTQSLFKNKIYTGIFEVYTDSILRYAQNPNSQVVYITDISNGVDTFISQPQISSLEELKGKKIGIDGINSYSHLFIIELLNLAGIESNEVEWINIPSEQIITALETHQIDAGYIGEPDHWQAIEKGYSLLASSHDLPNRLMGVLTLKKKFAQKYPQLIPKLIHSLDECYDYLKNHPVDSFVILSKETKKTADEIKNVLKEIKLISPRENMALFENKSKEFSIYQTGELLKNIYLKEKIIDSNFQIQQLMIPDEPTAIKTKTDKES